MLTAIPIFALAGVRGTEVLRTSGVRRGISGDRVGGTRFAGRRSMPRRAVPARRETPKTACGSEVTPGGAAFSTA